jgi:acetyl esterase/lipase
MVKRLMVGCVLILSGSIVVAQENIDLLTVADVMKFEHPQADERIQYGKRRQQFGDLRVPEGPGPHPVAVFIHGGCWLAQYDIAHSGRFTDALASNGIATWSLEYRRVGDGGGWPATFQDVAQGVDHLRSIAAEYSLDLNRVILMGHSAGGHLALWAAARSELPSKSPLSTPHPLPVRGVLALAPAPGLAALYKRRVGGGVVEKLMGGSPGRHRNRYRWVDLVQIAPTTPQILIVGKLDAAWAWSGLAYFNIAQARGDVIRLVEVPESGHFELIDPESSPWPLVMQEARDLLGIF